jgi:hypothetical protein
MTSNTKAVDRESTILEVWTGFMWLKIGASGRLEHGNEQRGISEIAERLLLSDEGKCIVNLLKCQFWW